jgi:hypothetical protein
MEVHMNTQRINLNMNSDILKELKDLVDKRKILSAGMSSWRI